MSSKHIYDGKEEESAVQKQVKERKPNLEGSSKPKFTNKTNETVKSNIAAAIPQGILKQFGVMTSDEFVESLPGMSYVNKSAALAKCLMRFKALHKAVLKSGKVDKLRLSTSKEYKDIREWLNHYLSSKENKANGKCPSWFIPLAVLYIQPDLFFSLDFSNESYLNDFIKEFDYNYYAQADVREYKVEGVDTLADVLWAWNVLLETYEQEIVSDDYDDEESEEIDDCLPEDIEKESNDDSDELSQEDVVDELMTSKDAVVGEVSDDEYGNVIQFISASSKLKKAKMQNNESADAPKEDDVQATFGALFD